VEVKKITDAQSNKTKVWKPAWRNKQPDSYRGDTIELVLGRKTMDPWTTQRCTKVAKGLAAVGHSDIRGGKREGETATLRKVATRQRTCMGGGRVRIRQSGR